MSTDLRAELHSIRERAARHDIPDPCAADDPDGCECCAVGRDNARLVVALEAVLIVHQPDEDMDCIADGDPWPCHTARVITAALTTDTKEADRG